MVTYQPYRCSRRKGLKHTPLPEFLPHKERRVASRRTAKSVGGRKFLPQRSKRAQRTPCFQHSVFSLISVANLSVANPRVVWFSDFAVRLGLQGHGKIGIPFALRRLFTSFLDARPKTRHNDGTLGKGVSRVLSLVMPRGERQEGDNKRWCNH